MTWIAFLLIGGFVGLLIARLLVMARDKELIEILDDEKKSSHGENQ